VVRAATFGVWRAHQGKHVLVGSTPPAAPLVTGLIAHVTWATSSRRAVIRPPEGVGTTTTRRITHDR
jgi:hypothetical protein